MRVIIGSEQVLPPRRIHFELCHPASGQLFCTWTSEMDLRRRLTFSIIIVVTVRGDLLAQAVDVILSELNRDEMNPSRFLDSMKKRPHSR